VDQRNKHLLPPLCQRTHGILHDGVAAGEPILFRFTKFWEKNIVIIREKWSVGIMINKEWLEPRLA
jgi:hypothetical protein